MHPLRVALGGLIVVSSLAGATSCTRIRVGECPEASPTAASPGEPVASDAAETGPTLGDFLRIRVASAVQVTPDGAVYMRDWPEGVHQLYRRAAESALEAAPEALTNFPDGITAFSLAPDGMHAVISAGTGGSEQDDLYLFDTRRGTLVALHQDPKVSYRFNHWLRDSSGFVFAANDVSAADFHLYLERLGSTPEPLLALDGSWWSVDVSPDGKRALVGRYFSTSNVHAYELDIRSGELTRVGGGGPSTAPRADRPVGYIDDSTVLWTSDIEAGENRLFTFETREGKRQKPLPELDGREVDEVMLGADRRHVAVVVNVDGYSELRLYRTERFSRVELPPQPKGLASPSQLTKDTLVWSVHSARDPGQPRLTRLDRATAKARPLAAIDDRGLQIERFAEPVLVHYPTFDGREIPAFLYLPAGHDPGTPIPFVVQYHGGPAGQSRPGFDGWRQAMLRRGFGILRPNVRGSTGYGQDYQRLDDYRGRWDSVRDGHMAARYLVDEGLARPGGIAAMGGSYGGFMALAVVIEDASTGGPSLFGAAIDVVGIVNFETFLRETKAYRRKLREAEYGPLDDLDFLRSISPIHRVEKIEVPVLIAHGLNDPRVPVGEAMQLAEALQRRGRAPEALYFSDEGHGFQKLDNRELFVERAMDFLARHIHRPPTP